MNEEEVEGFEKRAVVMTEDEKLAHDAAAADAEVAALRARKVAELKARQADCDKGRCDGSCQKEDCSS